MQALGGTRDRNAASFAIKARGLAPVSTSELLALRRGLEWRVSRPAGDGPAASNGIRTNTRLPV